MKNKNKKSCKVERGCLVYQRIKMLGLCVWMCVRACIVTQSTVDGAVNMHV